MVNRAVGKPAGHFRSWRALSSPFAVGRILRRYRWLLLELVLRDLRLRYRGSALGLAWTLLNPIIFAGLYTLIFAVFLKIQIHNFVLFLLAGLIPWTWISTALSQGAGALIDGRIYIGKSLFPSEVLIAVPVLSTGVNFLLSVPIILILAAFMKVNLGWSLITLPLLMLVEALMAEGLVMIFATLNVFFRDIQQLITYIITIGFYLTPIFYVRTMVPDQFRFLLDINPVAPLIAAYQDVFYSGTFPKLETLVYPAAFGVALTLLGQWLFLRYKDFFSQYV